jgi:hypothetical protein
MSERSVERKLRHKAERQVRPERRILRKLFSVGLSPPSFLSPRAPREFGFPDSPLSAGTSRVQPEPRTLRKLFSVGLSPPSFLSPRAPREFGFPDSPLSAGIASSAGTPDPTKTVFSRAFSSFLPFPSCYSCTPGIRISGLLPLSAGTRVHDVRTRKAGPSNQTWRI